MADLFTLDAQVRNDEGKGASRRLRRLNNLVPAVVYGEDKPAQSIAIELRVLSKALENEAFYSHILTLNIDGQAQKAVLKDVQRHPAKGFAMHADFMRISADHKIHMHVPLHFLNEEKCKGVKLQGGTISHQVVELEVVCLPNDLPEYIEVDMTDIEAGQTVHLTDLNLPEGVESAALLQGEDHDIAIAMVLSPRGGDSSSEEESAEGEGE